MSIQPVSPSVYQADSDTPWWRQLPDDFSHSREEFNIDINRKLQVHAVSMSDYFVRTLASTMVILSNLPKMAEVLDEKRRSEWNFYKNPRFLEEPNSFFESPPPVTVVARKSESFFLQSRVPDAQIEDLSFTSPFVPVNPALRDHPKFQKGFSSAFARHIRHPDGPQPTIICIHGFYLDPYEANSYIFDLPFLYNAGLDILLYTLPYHGPRRINTALFSGDGFVTHDVSTINENFAHSIYDFRIFMNYLEGLGVDHIGVTGVSLGGYHSAILASIEPRIRYAIPIIPVVSLLDIGLEWEPTASLLRFVISSLGASIQDIRHAMAVHTPLTHQPRLDRDKLFIIAGLADRMATPKHARILWEHWRRPEIHWFPGNHLLHLDRGAFFTKIEQFLRRNGVI